jgi:hypothetical protein
MEHALKRYVLPIFVVSLVMGSSIALGSVEGSLMAMQTKLINVILPLVGILGLVFAAFSFFLGNPNARSHLILAIFGAVIGFGAPSIIAFIRGIVN